MVQLRGRATHFVRFPYHVRSDEPPGARHPASPSLSRRIR